MTHLALLVLLALVQSVTTDTTIHVRPGMRLDVDLPAGGIVVRAWDRPDVRVVAVRPSDTRLLIDTTSGALRVRSRGGRDPVVQYEMTVLRAMNLTLGRGDVDVDVAGTQGEIVAMVRKGSVTVD